MPGDSRDDPVIRPTARVILVDPQDRVLLFRANMVDDDTGRLFWFMPGGGLEVDESFEQAAVRELYEETGLAIDAPGPLAWLRDHTWRWGEQWITSSERYYLVRTDAVEVAETYRTELELQVIVEHRWWPLADLASTLDLLVPRDLATLLPALLADGPASEPERVE